MLTMAGRPPEVSHAIPSEVQFEYVSVPGEAALLLSPVRVSRRVVFSMSVNRTRIQASPPH